MPCHLRASHGSTSNIGEGWTPLMQMAMRMIKVKPAFMGRTNSVLQRRSSNADQACQLSLPVSLHFPEVGAKERGGEGGGGGTGGEGGSGCDGGDDLAGNELSLEFVNLLQAVVAGAHVGQAQDEIHVVVGVVVLLERNRLQLVPSRQLGPRLLRRSGCTDRPGLLPEVSSPIP